MPDMDGYEVCERFKANEKTRDVPVIFISAAGGVLDKVKAFDAGGVDFVSKPYEPAEVLARVRLHLALRSLQEDLEARVRERTAELQQEMLARKRAEEEVRMHRDHLEELVRERTSELMAIKVEKKQQTLDANIIGRSAGMEKVRQLIKTVANKNVSVLIIGETGTGKEMVAQ